MFTDRTGPGAGGAGRRAALAASRRGPDRLGLRRIDRHARPAPRRRPRRHRDRRPRPPSAGAERRRLHRPRGDDHVLDLGRPRRDQEPAGDRRRVPRGQPEDHRQGHGLRLGHRTGTSSRPAIAGGDAPDVFAMDGPLFPDYQSRDVLLDLKPFIDRDGYDLGQLADQAVADFTTPDGQFGLPRDLNVIALFYNKTMFDAAGIPYPDETWDWAKLVEVAKKLTIKDADGKAEPVGLLHRDQRHGELLVVARLAERRRHHRGRPQDDPRRQRPGRRRHPVPPGPDLEGQGHARRGDRRRDIGDAFEQGKAAMEAERLVARRDPPGRRHRLRDRAAAEGPGRPGDVDQPDRRRRLQGHEEPGRRLGVREVPRQPGRPDEAHGAARRRCRRTRRSSPDRSRRRSTAPRSSPTRSRTPTSSPRSRATTSGRPTLQTELDANVFNAPNKTVKQAIDRRPAGARTGSSPASEVDAARPMAAMTAAAPPPAPGGGGGPLGRRGPLGAAVPRADAPRARRAVGRADPRDARDQPDEVGPAHARRSSSASTTSSRSLSDDRFLKALRNTFFYTVVSVPLGLAIALGSGRWRSTRRSAGSPGSGPPISCRS